MAEISKELNSELERLGFVFVRRNKHAIWKYPITGGMLTVSSTLSDRRGMKNVLGDARRIIRGAHQQKEAYAQTSA